jgi:hypothetical protein
MDQTIGHKVPPIIKGIKYVVRTELMYLWGNLGFLHIPS